jgi:hypothetical protein
LCSGHAEAKKSLKAAAEQFSNWIRERIMAEFDDVTPEEAGKYTLRVVEPDNDNDPRESGATALVVTTSGKRLEEYLTGDAAALQHLTRGFLRRWAVTAAPREVFASTNWNACMLWEFLVVARCSYPHLCCAAKCQLALTAVAMLVVHCRNHKWPICLIMDEDDINPASEKADKTAREISRKSAIELSFYLVSITATPASLLLTMDSWLGAGRRMQLLRMPIKPDYYGLWSGLPLDRRVQHQSLERGMRYSKDVMKANAGEVMGDAVQRQLLLLMILGSWLHTQTANAYTMSATYQP